MKKILIFAPHPDDELLGVGGTMIKNIKDGNEVYVCIVTKGYPPIFDIEDIAKNMEDAKLCHKTIGVSKTFFLDFPAVNMENVDRVELNSKIMNVIKEVCPDEVYIPHYGDMQKDHIVVADACMVALRPKYFPQATKILGYETMSETDWNTPNVQNAFIPNVFVNITDVLADKLKALSYYTLQISNFPNARSLGAIEALARYRGALMHWPAAEAFMLIRELN